jgi:alkanesulfonate monooxygenase SsuD/methylene tetrahydromethanopterin reductase-like flavin-dependent oxidoreductase (luciferase family)
MMWYLCGGCNPVGDRMLIGFNAPVARSLAEPEVLTRTAAEGKAMGFDYLAFSDHIVIPTDIQARYPYSDTGAFPQGARGGRHEQLTEIAILAAKTSRLRPVTSVMVALHRPAVPTAKIDRRRRRGMVAGGVRGHRSALCRVSAD